MRISDWSSDVCSSDLAGADRPDRLIGDDELAFMGVLGQRALQLPGPHRDMIAGGAVRLGFADADDGLETVAQRRIALGADVGVGLVIFGPALAVADHAEAGMGFLEHPGGAAAGTGALVRGPRVAGKRR